MERLICLLIGYVFGLFQTGYLYGKMHHIDIRQHGSGNAGTTNALRVLGKKAALVVFLGDAFKTIFACMFVRWIYNGSPNLDLLAFYAAFGAVLGHNFPFYLKFLGGKGIAATAGLLLSTDWRMCVICALVFFTVVLLTRYVSLGSILMLIVFFIMTILFGKSGEFCVLPEFRIEFYVLSGAIMLMGIGRHHANIKRLISGKENKLWGNKK